MKNNSLYKRSSSAQVVKVAKLPASGGDLLAVLARVSSGVGALPGTGFFRSHLGG